MLKKLLLCILISFSSLSFSKNMGQIEKMHIRYKEFLISQGESLKTLSDVDKKKVIEQADNTGLKALASLEKQVKENKFKFDSSDDKNIGIDLRAFVIEISNLAKATETKGSKLYNDKNAQMVVIKSLEKLKEAYKVGGKELGNWWNWEIGIPKSLNELLIVADYIPKDLKEELIKASYYFQPDPNYSGKAAGNKYSTNPNIRETTGGNRADTSIISLGRGIVTNDIKEIDRAILAISKLNEEKTKYSNENTELSSDGFYPDGSFIQHISVPYNGTYGAVLLNGLGFFSYIVGDYEKFDTSKVFNLIYKNILVGYPYLFINGGINDSVNGRSLSRDNTSDLTRAREIVENLAMISYYAPEPYKAQFQSLIKKVLVENNYNNQIELLSNRVRKVMLTEIFNDKNIKPMEVKGVKVFPFMDRAVQINSNGGKVVVAMHSNRIANYETMNGENLKGWFTGDGMTYLYTNASNAYTDYYQALDYYHIPGTTESTKELKDAVNSMRVERSDKSFVGGAGNSKVAMIAMDFESPQKDLTAKKSYVFLGDVVVAMGSGINGKDGHEVHTTVENRLLNENETVDNKGNVVTFKNTKTNENITYTKLIGDFETKVETREGSFKLIGGKSDKVIKKDYLKIVINHGKNPKDAKYAYVLAPMVKDFNEKLLKMVSLDNIHALTYKNMSFINFYTAGKKLGIEVKNPLSVIRIMDGKNISLLVANPSHNLSEAEVILDGKYKTTDKNVSLKTSANKTIIKIKLNSGDTTKVDLIKIN